MSKRLSFEEFMVAPLPMHFLRITADHWCSGETVMLNKWIDQNIAGWVYSEDGPRHEVLYVFESPGDWMMFKMWVSSEPLDKEGWIE